MIGSITDNLRKLARQYSGQEIHNEDGTYTQVADILLCAANTIEELQQIAGHYEESAHDYFKDVCYYLERMPKWIPVTERLPEVGKSVLVISYGRVCFAKLLLTKNNGGFPTFVLQDGLNNPPVLETTAHSEFTENRITHWQYLPEPPKDGE